MRDITVVIPVSPIRSHPSTVILDETMESVRNHLPDAEIVITFDGVRPEQEFRRGDYERFMQAALWRSDHLYRNVMPLIFDSHLHQTGMLRKALPEIGTPLLLYMEQDAPLVTGEPVDWEKIAEFVLSGESNSVRLHHEAVIPAEHEHMMHGDVGGFIRTSQWSQRPHVASTAFYDRIMSTCFSPGARSFIEDRMHGVIDEAYRQHGMPGWEQYRTHIYNPGPNLRRSYHTDGRAGEPKYDDSQVF